MVPGRSHDGDIAGLVEVRLAQALEDLDVLADRRLQALQQLGYGHVPVLFHARLAERKRVGSLLEAGDVRLFARQVLTRERQRLLLDDADEMRERLLRRPLVRPSSPSPCRRASRRRRGCAGAPRCRTVRSVLWSVALVLPLLVLLLDFQDVPIRVRNAGEGHSWRVLAGSTMRPPAPSTSLSAPSLSIAWSRCRPTFCGPLPAIAGSWRMPIAVSPGVTHEDDHFVAERLLEIERVAVEARGLVHVAHGHDKD